MTIAELRKRLAEINAPDNAELCLWDVDGHAFHMTYIYPPAWPGGGGSPTVDIDITAGA